MLAETVMIAFDKEHDDGGAREKGGGEEGPVVC